MFGTYRHTSEIFQVPDNINKASHTHFFVFPVQIKFVFILYCTLLCTIALCFKKTMYRPFSSAQFSRSVMSNSLRPHGLHHARLPCPSLTPGAYSNSCPSSQWCHLTISSSVGPFSSCLQSFPASGSFSISQFFAKGKNFECQVAKVLEFQPQYIP